MSSYFDNQYTGGDPDTTFNEEEESTDSSSSNSSSDSESLEEEYEEEEEEEEDSEEEEENDQEGGAQSDELEEGEIDEEAEKNMVAEKKTKKIKRIPQKKAYNKPDFADDDEYDDDDGEMYLQKFDKSINENYIVNCHPESVLQNYDEILAMIKVIRDKHGIIIDDLHRTIPYLTKYEKSRILGQRAKQINSGARPFIKVPENVIDGYIIAELELKEKKIPFIIRRPMPNGGSEYWSIKDLEDISF